MTDDDRAALEAAHRLIADTAAQYRDSWGHVLNQCGEREMPDGIVRAAQLERAAAILRALLEAGEGDTAELLRRYHRQIELSAAYYEQGDKWHRAARAACRRLRASEDRRRKAEAREDALLRAWQTDETHCTCDAMGAILDAANERQDAAWDAARGSEER